MARTLLLAAMLAVALGCDPGAAEPTAFAPDDLARVLPDRIGDVPLEVVSATRDDPVVAAYHRYAEGVARGNRGSLPSPPLALRFAKAVGGDVDGGRPLEIYAIRVDGVPTTDAVALIDELGLGPSRAGESYRIDGQDVTWSDHGQGTWSQLYQMGEVLFVVVGSTDRSVTVRDVLAALPRCQRQGAEWQEPCRAPS